MMNEKLLINGCNDSSLVQANPHRRRQRKRLKAGERSPNSELITADMGNVPGIIVSGCWTVDGTMIWRSR